MTDATPLSCPNCGAGLGAMEAGQYRCSYCGHRSLPARPAVDAGQRAAMLAAALEEFEKRRARAMGAREELQRRERDAAASTRRVNGFVMLGIGGLFLIFALVCFGGAAATALAPDEPPPVRHGRVAPRPSASGQGIGGILAFGAFWAALGGGMFYIGVRYRRADSRDRKMRESGLRGRATVKSYRESNIVVDGNVKFDLVLEVEVPGRPPFVVKQSDYVPHPGSVTTGAELPVFVDPRGTDVMVDWYTTGRA